MGSLWAPQHGDDSRQDLVSVNCSWTPLFVFYGPVQREEEEHARPNSRLLGLFGLKCLRLKRTQDSLRTRSGSWEGSLHSGRAWLCGIFHCRLNWTFMYIKIIRPHFKQAREQDMGNAIQQLTSTVHRRIIYCFYMWTANSDNRERKVCHTRLRWVMARTREAASKGTLSRIRPSFFFCPLTLK